MRLYCVIGTQATQLPNYVLPYTCMRHVYIFCMPFRGRLFSLLHFGLLPSSSSPTPGPPYYRVELKSPYPNSYNLGGGGDGSEDPLLGGLQQKQPVYAQAPPTSQGKPADQQQQQYPPPTRPQQYPRLPDVNAYEVAGINSYTGGQYPQATRPRDRTDPTERTGLLNS